MLCVISASTPILKTKNNDDDIEPLTDRSIQPSPILPAGKGRIIIQMRKIPFFPFLLESSAKPNNRDDVSVIDDEELNETNADVELNSEADKPLDDVSIAPMNTSQKDEFISPSTPLPALPKPDIRTPPLRKGRSPLPPQTPNQDLSQSAADLENNNPQSPITSPAPLPDTNEIDDADFFS